MPRYKPYDYNQLMMIPVSLEEQLVPGTLEYAIHHLIEEWIDTSFFDERFCNDDTGRSAYDPKVLLKIVLFGYSRGTMSSRPLERACVENVVFMALACGQKPDHSTIEAFVSSMGDEIGRLYTQVLLIFVLKRRVGIVDRWTNVMKWMLYCLVHNIEKVLYFGISYAMAA